METPFFFLIPFYNILYYDQSPFYGFVVAWH